MVNKINVYYNEYNLLMGSRGATYLPFVSGILSANAKKINKLKIFEKLNKFGKYNSIDTKNNRLLTS